MRAADYEIKNLDKLDRILVKLCSMVIEGQKSRPEFFGMVAACVLDPDNNIVAGLNYYNEDTGDRVHAERAAMEAYQRKYGEIPAGSIIVTTCSPCSEHMEERDGPSCTDLVNHSTVHKVYCGYLDPTQDEDQRTFTLQETNNPQIRELCEMFASTFIDDEELDENFADGRVKGKSRPGRVKRAGASCNGSVTDLRQRAKNSSGERAKMYHWCANMKSGRQK